MRFKWTWVSILEIFIVHFERKAADRTVWQSGCTFAALAVIDHVLQECLSVGGGSIDVSRRGPPALADDDFEVRVSDLVERHMQRVDHGVEDVLVGVVPIVNPVVLARGK